MGSIFVYWTAFYLTYNDGRPTQRDGCLAWREDKVETPYHDNDLILTPIISPQSG
jgi:hypothetical protein